MINFPKSLLTQLCRANDFDTDAFLEAHEAKNQITSIRLNPFKSATFSFPCSNPVPWHPNAFYLNERPYFTHDPLFHAGAYYVQEAGSMFIAEAFKQQVDLSADLTVLDACAAPGGKSTLINSLINENSLLVANELIKSRADVLAQNLSRWGTANTVVTNNNPDKFTSLKNFFDVMVVDAPCSGSGLFRKQPEAINEWSDQSVAACEIRQKSILETLLPSLKNNGTLIYSTCSYSFEENEAVVQWLVNEHHLQVCPLQINPEWGIVEGDYGYRFYPHLTKSEGFFCCVLKKTNADGASPKQGKVSLQITKNETEICKPFIAQKSNLLTNINGRLHLLNPKLLSFMSLYDKHFYFKKVGVLVGEIKKKDLVPHQELAWSLYLSKDVNLINLELDMAINYLKKENLILANAGQGLTLFAFQNLGIGWAKVLSNRINNYLPNELKILR